MYTHILLPTDGSDLSTMALHEGIDLAKALGARATIITVTAPFHVIAGDPAMLTDTPEQYKKRMAATAARYLDAAKKIAAVAGVRCDTIHVEHEHPHQAIIDTAESKGCDVIVMASHGRRGMSAVVLGSVTLSVLTHSIIPVVVYRQPRMSIAQFVIAS